MASSGCVTVNEVVEIRLLGGSYGISRVALGNDLGGMVQNPIHYIIILTVLLDTSSDKRSTYPARIF
jgi:hypothetical protein